MIRTARLTLRPWEDRDRAPFAAMTGDPRIMSGFPGPMSPSESNELLDYYIARWDEDGYGYAAVERRFDRAFLGLAGLAPFRAATPPGLCFEIGWSLAYPHWGRGYATEAAQGWIDYGFGALRLPEIVAFTEPGNVRSLAVMARLGLRPAPERDFVQPPIRDDDPPRPQVVHALTRVQWSTVRAGAEGAAAPRSPAGS